MLEQRYSIPPLRKKNYDGVYMNSKVNGVGGKGFGDFEIEPLVERGLRRLTDDFHQELLKKLLGKPLSEDFLISFYEFRNRPIQPTLEEMDKIYFDLYKMDKRYFDLYEMEILSFYGI